MHETAVAQSLVELIAQEAESRHAKPIRAKMSCGELNAINDEALTFAFEAIAEGTRVRRDEAPDRSTSHWRRSARPAAVSSPSILRT